MIYELINPSDPYTFIADCCETAALTTFCLSSAYGAKPQEGDEEVPAFLLGNPDKWYKDTFGRSVPEGLEAKKQELIKSLDSMLYGDFDKRAIYEAAIKAITDEDKRREYEKAWSDRRSSFNDIGAYAKQLAKAMLRKEKANGKDDEHNN